MTLTMPWGTGEYRMLLIPCPWCGRRDETEFRYGGQAHLAYPADPASLSDEAWADFLFMRDNPRGWWSERWMHAAGCRRWFNLTRNTRDERDRRRVPDGRGRHRRCWDDLARSTTAAMASTGRYPIGPSPSMDASFMAYEGDTVASALLGGGIDVVCPSPILGRPRGVFSAGAEEPNAFVRVTRSRRRPDHAGDDGQGR